MFCAVDESSAAEKNQRVDIAERFAENLKRQRKLTPWSQEELAFRAEIHRTQISQFEGGNRIPRLDTLVKLAGALEIHPAALLDGMAWEPAATKSGSFDFPDKS
jgi:transcriptional regulator with XRE-family HTH domain